MAGQAERFRGFRFIEAGTLERSIDHVALDQLQLVSRGGFRGHRGRTGRHSRGRQLHGLVGRLLTGSLLDRFFGPRVSFFLLVVVALGTFLLASARSFASGGLAAALIGFGMGGESDVTPYLLSRYFGLRSFSTLYGFTWTATSLAGAIGPIVMGRTFDTTGSYELLLVKLAGGTLAVAASVLLMPRYNATVA